MAKFDIKTCSCCYINDCNQFSHIFQYFVVILIVIKLSYMKEMSSPHFVSDIICILSTFYYLCLVLLKEHRILCVLSYVWDAFNVILRGHICLCDIAF